MLVFTAVDTINVTGFTITTCMNMTIRIYTQNDCDTSAFFNLAAGFCTALGFGF